MVSHKYYVYIGLVCVSVCFSIAFGFVIFRVIGSKFHTIRPDVIIHLSKDNYIFPSVGKFSHYFEPKPNTPETWKLDWLPYTAISTINAEGLNERYDYPEQKAEGVFRIVTLGDSFTYGMLVNTKDNYPEQLEDLLNSHICPPRVRHFDVINLGVPAYDVGMSVERFRLHGQKYRPDVVIWFFNSFNFDVLADYERGLEEKYVREISQQEIREHEKRGEYYYPGIKAYNDTIARFGLGTIRKQEGEYLHMISTYYPGPLILAVNKWDSWAEETKTIIRWFVHARPNTYLFSDVPLLTKDRGSLEDGHPDVTGHTMIAESLYKYVVDNDLPRCNK